ncbi:unnamed protein product [Meloidogyne enterolobii]|uniref:Uncharacterized protein n=1 Tax=Meloidogyne enterolobii TaxID=390850 RepID=A0ACB0ZL23_MELEN
MTRGLVPSKVGGGGGGRGFEPVRENYFFNMKKYIISRLEYFYRVFWSIRILLDKKNIIFNIHTKSPKIFKKIFLETFQAKFI